MATPAGQKLLGDLLLLFKKLLLHVHETGVHFAPHGVETGVQFASQGVETGVGLAAQGVARVGDVAGEAFLDHRDQVFALFAAELVQQFLQGVGGRVAELSRNSRDTEITAMTGRQSTRSRSRRQIRGLDAVSSRGYSGRI